MSCTILPDHMGDRRVMVSCEGSPEHRRIGRGVTYHDAVNDAVRRLCAADTKDGCEKCQGLCDLLDVLDT